MSLLYRAVYLTCNLWSAFISQIAVADTWGKSQWNAKKLMQHKLKNIKQKSAEEKAHSHIHNNVINGAWSQTEVDELILCWIGRGKTQLKWKPSSGTYSSSPFFDVRHDLDFLGNDLDFSIVTKPTFFRKEIPDFIRTIEASFRQI